MLTEKAFILYCLKLGLSAEAQELLGAIRNRPPCPRDRDNFDQYAPVHYPSRKMAHVIQAESYKNELAGLIEMDHDDDIYEFYDRPPKITLHFEAKNGRKLKVEHTPDYFVIRNASLGWVEWKTEEHLIRLAEDQPNRYGRGEDGKWYCPPGEAVAAPLGFYYQIRSFAEINWIYLRNLVFLEDYLQASPLGVSAAAYKAIRAFVEVHPGVTLRELLSQVAGVTLDDMYTLIAHKQVLADLSADPLDEPERVHLFLEDSYAK